LASAYLGGHGNNWTTKDLEISFPSPAEAGDTTLIFRECCRQHGGRDNILNRGCMNYMRRKKGPCRFPTHVIRNKYVHFQKIEGFLKNRNIKGKPKHRLVS
jgi:hypothetical protein